jgi:hypothetical protein
VVGTGDGVLRDSPEWRKGAAVDMLAWVGLIDTGETDGRVLFDILRTRKYVCQVSI